MESTVEVNHVWCFGEASPTRGRLVCYRGRCAHFSHRDSRHSAARTHTHTERFCIIPNDEHTHTFWGRKNFN